MASVYGYNTPGDMRVFYPKEEYTILGNEGSILCFLQNHPDTQLFYNIVKTAKLEWLLDGLMFNNTIFVPLDSELLKVYCKDYILNMSQEISYRIVKYSIIQGKIEYWLLNTINYSILNPCDNFYDRIELSNDNGNIILNNQINVLKLDKICNNGVILFTNNLLIPYNYS